MFEKKRPKKLVLDIWNVKKINYLYMFGELREEIGMMNFGKYFSMGIMRNISRLLFLIALGFMFAPSISSSQQTDLTPHTQARLVTYQKQVAPGDRLQLGLHLEFEPHWHTYWKNSGDSGTSPRFTWQNSRTGAALSAEMNWPGPSRLTTGPLTTFIYEESVLFSFLFPAEVTQSAGSDLELRLDAEWLVCKEECVPAFKSFDIHIPINAPTQRDTKNAFIFEYYREKIPEASIFGKYVIEDQKLLISIPDQSVPGGKNLEAINAATAIEDFFPFTYNRVRTEKPSIIRENQQWLLTQPLIEPNATYPAADYEGVIKAENTYFNLRLTEKPGLNSAVALQVETMTDWKAILQSIIFAFFGGLILNIMPCVFPIVSLKIFSFFKAKHPARIKKESLVYTLGVLMSFVAIALFILVLKSFGVALGWGFQLQSPYFVYFLALIFTLLALSFIDLLQFSFIPVSSHALTDASYMRDFWSGVLAVLVASPCSAPFMGVAVGFALAQPTIILFAVFLSLGVGFAFPYILLIIAPGILRKLPRSGPWLIHFKHFLFFPMLLTVLWLCWLLGQIFDSSATALSLAACILLSAVVWTHRHRQDLSKFVAYALIIVLLSLFAAASIATFQVPTPARQTALHKTGTLEWEVFSSERLDRAIADEKAVFVNFTADWCITCKVNERLVFQQADVVAHLRGKNILSLKADWTRYDPAITQFLAQYDRAAVPFYLYFAPGSTQGKVLPEILTPQTLIEGLQ